MKLKIFLTQLIKKFIYLPCTNYNLVFESFLIQYAFSFFVDIHQQLVVMLLQPFLSLSNDNNKKSFMTIKQANYNSIRNIVYFLVPSVSY